MSTYVLNLPWTKPPLSLNDRRGVHWSVKSRKIREVREAGYFLAKKAGIGRCERVRIELHYQPRDRRVRDDENPVATLKALADGLVDAGVVEDDTNKFMVKLMPVIHEPVRRQPGRLWLVIECLEGAA